MVAQEAVVIINNMEKNNRPLIITSIIVVGILVMALALIFIRNNDSQPEETTEKNTAENKKKEEVEIQPEQLYQPSSRLEAVMADAGFICSRQTYADLRYATEEITSAIVERLADAGIASAEVVFCSRESDGTVIGVSLPANVEKLNDITPDFTCETGQKLAGINREEDLIVLLIDGLYHMGNAAEDTELLADLLDQNEIDYEEQRLNVKECEIEA